MTRKGLDISSWQHPNNAPIDWPAVKAAGYEWAGIKVTEGVNYVNPWAAQDCQAADAAGLEVVAYHFVHPVVNTAAAESAWFRQNVDTIPSARRRAVDLEDGQQHGWPAVDEWMRELIAGTPLDLAYMDGSYWQGLGSHPEPWNLGLWAADPDGTWAPAEAKVVQGRPGGVTGVQGYCDLDVVNYDLAVPGGPPPPPQQPAGAVVDVQVPVLAAGHAEVSVKSVQALLNRAGGHLVIDGVFGPVTAQNLAEYQTAKGLSGSGVCDQATWQHLLTT